MTAQVGQYGRKPFLRYGVGLVGNDNVGLCSLGQTDAVHLTVPGQRIGHGNHQSGTDQIVQLRKRCQHIGRVGHACGFQNDLLCRGRVQQTLQARAQAVRQSAAYTARVQRLHVGFAPGQGRIQANAAQLVLDDGGELFTPVQIIKPAPQKCGFACAKKAGEHMHNRQGAFLFAPRPVPSGQTGKRPALFRQTGHQLFFTFFGFGRRQGYVRRTKGCTQRKPDFFRCRGAWCGNTAARCGGSMPRNADPQPGLITQ